MTPREVSVEFLRAFCAGDLESLRGLLSEDLQFEGPFHRFDSRDAYLRSLEEDPSEEAASYRLRRLFEDDDEVCLIWEYVRPQSTVLIAQWNRFRGQKIAAILLVFDARGLPARTNA